MCVSKKLFDVFIYLLLYVDDMLIVYKNMFEIYRLKTQLRGEFEMKDLGAQEKNWIRRFMETKKWVNYVYHVKSALRKYWSTWNARVKVVEYPVSSPLQTFRFFITADLGEGGTHVMYSLF